MPIIPRIKVSSAVPQGASPNLRLAGRPGYAIQRLGGAISNVSEQINAAVVRRRLKNQANKEAGINIAFGNALREFKSEASSRSGEAGINILSDYNEIEKSLIEAQVGNLGDGLFRDKVIANLQSQSSQFKDVLSVMVQSNQKIFDMDTFDAFRAFQSKNVSYSAVGDLSPVGTAVAKMTELRDGQNPNRSTALKSLNRQEDYDTLIAVSVDSWWERDSVKTSEWFKLREPELKAKLSPDLFNRMKNKVEAAEPEVNYLRAIDGLTKQFTAEDGTVDDIGAARYLMDDPDRFGLNMVEATRVSNYLVQRGNMNQKEVERQYEQQVNMNINFVADSIDEFQSGKGDLGFTDIQKIISKLDIPILQKDKLQRRLSKTQENFTAEIIADAKMNIGDYSNEDIDSLRNEGLSGQDIILLRKYKADDAKVNVNFNKTGLKLISNALESIGFEDRYPEFEAKLNYFIKKNKLRLDDPSIYDEAVRLTQSMQEVDRWFFEFGYPSDEEQKRRNIQKAIDEPSPSLNSNDMSEIDIPDTFVEVSK